MDQYSLLHFASGVIAYFFGISWPWWLIIHIVFEIVENTTLGMDFINNFTFWPGGKSHADSLLNSTGDTVFAMLGWYMAYLLDKQFK